MMNFNENKFVETPGAGEPCILMNTADGPVTITKDGVQHIPGEFQLYRAEDVEHIEGEGWTPKDGAVPIDPDYKPQPMNDKREALVTRRKRRHALRDRRIQAVQRLCPAGKKVRGNRHRLQRKRQRLVQRLISQR